MSDAYIPKEYFPVPTGPMKRSVGVLVVLLLVAVGVRVWMMNHSETISKDGVGYVAMARAMAVDAGEAIRTHPRHPGYPSMILVSHALLRSVGVVDDSVEGWDIAGRWVSILASVAVLVGLWMLAVQGFDRRVAWITVLLSALARKWAAVGCDVLADPLSVAFQVWTGVAAIAAVRCYRDRSKRAALLVVLVGLGAAGAYYVRPEGGQIIIASGVCWLLCAGFRDRRWDWALISGGVALGVMLLVASPYMMTIGGLTCRKLHLGAPQASMVGGLLAARAPGTIFWSAVSTFISQLTEAMHPILAGLGLGWLIGFTASRWGQHPVLMALVGPSPRRAPTVLVATSVVVLAGLTIPQHIASGMLSHRYLLFCAVGLSPLAGAGVVMVARLICHLAERLGWKVIPSLAIVLVLVPVTAGLVFHGFQPLHETRTFLRRAGEYVAENAGPDDILLTDLGLVTHYADIPSVDIPGYTQLTPRRLFLECATKREGCPTLLAIVNVPLRHGHYNSPDLHSALDADPRFERLETFTREDEKEQVAIYRIAAEGP
jgi:hypothetical protein